MTSSEEERAQSRWWANPWLQLSLVLGLSLLSWIGLGVCPSAIASGESGHSAALARG